MVNVSESTTTSATVAMVHTDVKIRNPIRNSKEAKSKYRPGRERNIFLTLIVNVMKINSVYTRQNQKWIYKVKRRNRLQ